MRTISFNKKEEMVVCLFCGVSKVPLRKRSLRCVDCKSQKIKSEKIVVVTKRTPSAVITTENGEKVFVDEHGKEVTDHPYDLKNDPRGYKATGQAPKERTII